MMRKNQMNTGIFWEDMNSYFERDKERYNQGDNYWDNLIDSPVEKLKALKDRG